MRTGVYYKVNGYAGIYTGIYTDIASRLPATLRTVMIELFIILATGLGLELLTFLGLRRIASWPAWQSAIAAAGIGLLCYLPTAVWAWPGIDGLVLSLSLLLLLPLALAMAITARGTTEQGKRGLHWGPASLLLFFGALVLVNAIFAIIAERGLPTGLAKWFLSADAQGTVTTHFPGTVARDFQEKEALYNSYLAKRQAQAERGWQVRQGWLRQPHAGELGRLQLEALDSRGQPIVGASVTGRFLRPADQDLDQSFIMTEQGQGRYLAEVRLPAPGHWDAIIEIEHGTAWHEVRAQTEVLAGRR